VVRVREGCCAAQRASAAVCVCGVCSVCVGQEGGKRHAQKVGVWGGGEGVFGYVRKRRRRNVSNAFRGCRRRGGVTVHQYGIRQPMLATGRTTEGTNRVVYTMSGVASL